MELDSAIEKRHSSRSFKSKKASWKDILKAIEAASKAPFSDNRNNLRFLIIENEKTIEKISGFANQLWINEAAILVLVCSNDSNLENMHGERGRIYSRQQAGAAIENFLLKLTDLGLNSCWIGSYKDELIKQLLKIPEHIQVEAIIPVGYESGNAGKKRKKDLDTLIYWEEWETENRPAFIHEGQDPDPSSLFRR